MKEQILTLEHGDDLHSMRDKIARAQAQRLVLLWGALEEPLSRRLDLVLMKRWAAMAGSELAIVSADEAVHRLARLAGVPCHPTLTESALAALSTRSDDMAKAEKIRPARRRIAAFPPGKSRSPEVAAPIRIGFFAAAILSLTAVFLLLYPSAELEVAFSSRDVEAAGMLDRSLCTQLSTSLALSDRRMTTGKTLAPTAFATGSVFLTNVSSRLLNLSAGLHVASESGVIFETVDGVILPPGESRTTPIRALEPGSDSNLAAGKVSLVLGPLSLSLKVENPSPTSGGEEAWRSAVTQADWNALQTALEEKILEEASTSLRTLAGENRMVVEESLKVEFDPLDAPDLPVHTPADSVGLTLHAEASLLACPLDLVRSRTVEILGSHLQPGEILYANGRTARLAENAEGGIDLTATGMAIAVPDWNAMTLALRFQTPGQAEEILRDRFHALGVSNISLNPAWIPVLPLFPYQIGIEAVAE